MWTQSGRRSVGRGVNIAAAMLLAAATASFGQNAPADPRIDPASGRQIALWPPDRPFDHLHMRLELDFPDMQQAGLIGTMTLRAAAIGTARTEIPLDCKGPSVLSVTSGGKTCGFKQADDRLLITLPQAAPPGVPVEVVVRYMLDFSKNKGEGLTYSSGKADADSITRQFPQLHAQGEAQLNSKWFPCHDSPNEKLTTELVVTVEDGYEVVSNGHLVNKASAGSGVDGTPRMRWHWLQDKPHSPYLVTLVVGKLARLDLGGPDSARPGLSIPVYTPFGTEDTVRELYSATPAMIAFFEQKFDEPYPWDQYAQCIVRDFVAGGMENTGCTLMTMGSTRGGPGSQDSLISHELAHQWFGDLVTCKTWSHIWLNEGWASYCEALWNEHKGSLESEEKGRIAYQKTVRGWIQGQRSRNKTVAPRGAPLVTNRYMDPDAMFSRAEDPYGKGALILHMLRVRVGDEAFFAATRAYLNKYKFDVAETDDFRRELERFSGQSLERFFDQWANRCGLPRLGAELDWDDAAKTLSVRLEQTQKIDGMNPAFAFTLPILAKFADGSTRWLSIDMDAPTASATFGLEEKPTHVTLDPEMSVIAAVDIKKDLAWWINDLEHGPTFASRMLAAENLSFHQSEHARAALTRIAADQWEDPTLRAVALRGMAMTVAGR